MPNKRKLFLLFALMILFFAISDGIITFLIPIIITDAGISASLMGILFASGSIFGALFDFLLSKALRNTNYKQVYLYAIVLLFALPLIVFTSNILLLFVLGMALQGLYSNLASYGTYDFIGRESSGTTNTAAFAYIEVFNDMGYALGPLMATQFFIGTNALSPILLLSVLIIICGLFFLATVLSKQKDITNNINIVNEVRRQEHIKTSFWSETLLWIRVSRRLWPLLLLGVSLAIMESVFWTVTPLIDRLSENLHGLGGIIMALTLIPSLFVNWSAGPLTARFGKKKTAYMSFLICNLVLFAVGFVQNPYVVILLIFVSSLLEALAFPALGGAFGDYLQESKSYDNEIVTTRSFMRNIGFVIGPIIGGYLLEKVANLSVFSYVAIYGVIVSLILIILSPRTIDFHDKSV